MAAAMACTVMRHVASHCAAARSSRLCPELLLNPGLEATSKNKLLRNGSDRGNAKDLVAPEKTEKRVRWQPAPRADSPAARKQQSTKEEPACIEIESGSRCGQLRT